MVSQPKMSRGSYRLEGKCTITWAGPVHVGTSERLSVVTDAPLLRNGKGEPYLPGSSIRGVLRDWCERELILLEGIDQEHLIRLFGPTPEELRKKKNSSPERTLAEKIAGNNKVDEHDRQGRLTVGDATFTGFCSEVRDHVRLERKWGAATSGGKFDQEVSLPRTAEFILLYEGDGPADPEIALLLSAIEAIEQGILAFGGKTGWGLGAVDKFEVKWRALDRGEIDELATYLKERLGLAQVASITAPPLNHPQYKKGTVPFTRNNSQMPAPWSWMRLDLRLQFDGPMLVAGHYRGDNAAGHDLRKKADAAYQTTPAGQPFLAGSSLRGALQAHARRIARTMGREDLAELLFGIFKDEQEKRGEEKARPDQSRNSGARTLLRVGEGKLEGDPHPIMLNHVAIDRITGFAVEGKLFDAAALASPCFSTSLLVRWHAAVEHEAAGQEAASQETAAVALLLFTLRDLKEGLLWVGSRTTRGYGYIKDMEITRCLISEVVTEFKDKEILLQRQPRTEMNHTSITQLNQHPTIKRIIAQWAKAIPDLHSAKEASHG